MRIFDWAAIGCAAMLAAGSLPAAAQDYPAKPVTVVVPFSPGGASDTIARVVTNAMQPGFAQPLVVENKPGANGAVGAAQVARARPDGYTIMQASIGAYAINPALQDDLPYDPRKDLDMLTIAVRTPNALVTRPTMEAATLEELIAKLKAEPDSMLFASSGTGSSDHLTAELFWQVTGTSGIHVPYKGGGPAQTDLMGGHADASFQNLGAIANFVRDGKMKLLAIAAEERSPEFPDVPTLKELGIEGMEVYSWQAFAAPKGLDPAIRQTLSDQIAAALKTPAVSDQLKGMGFEIIANTPAEADAFVAAEIDRWTEVVKAGEIKPEG
ncbi:Bug family tripartite tricarboxylate transporter substrate binding protein [Paracoccus yeei]|uniref:Tripartite tricarboxylate transporter substrate binding protein n=1 Tax=Paracoccus yeei TaxID=147645 RepID=A0A5P2QZI0_9RHOB|nr:tripartite tricarboxylate transporter substrate binding protein [Paracoccus yeei]MBY0135055.1 tripartite tricarboxylate transporter substrate binding protein [Paracoccus yeei]QEU10703.1 tripartite tricarboxylate transporter substrate binding protein [Paracoccus yeei]